LTPHLSEPGCVRWGTGMLPPRNPAREVNVESLCIRLRLCPLRMCAGCAIWQPMARRYRLTHMPRVAQPWLGELLYLCGGCSPLVLVPEGVEGILARSLRSQYRLAQQSARKRLVLGPAKRLRYDHLARLRVNG
jgi:hypothetical protein